MQSRVALVALTHEFFKSTLVLEPGVLESVERFLDKFGDDPWHKSLEMHRIEGARDRRLYGIKVAERLHAVLADAGRMYYMLFLGTADECIDWARNHETHVQENVLRVAIRDLSRTQHGSALERELRIPPAAVEQAGISGELAADLTQARSSDDLLRLVFDADEDTGDVILKLATGEPLLDGADELCRTGESAPENPHPADERTLFDSEQYRIQTLDRFQKRLVTQMPRGPVKVTGGPGTGKTLVAIHRARALAAVHKRVLLCSYTKSLVGALDGELRGACTDDERTRITTSTVHARAKSVLGALVQNASHRVVPNGLREREIKEMLTREYVQRDCSLPLAQVLTEWREVVEARSLWSEEEYLSAPRTGIGTRLTESQRREVWGVLGALLQRVRAQGASDFPGMCRLAREWMSEDGYESPYDAVVVDEYQDLRLEELRFLKALCRDERLLMLTGDAAQQIYTSPVPLRDAGIDIQGRTTNLKITYRTTAEINQLAEKALGANQPPEDADGTPRVPAIAAEHGPAPIIDTFKTADGETTFICEIIRQLRSQGVEGTIAVLAPTRQRREQLERDLIDRGVLGRVNEYLDCYEDGSGDPLCVKTFHNSKGLEYEACIVSSLEQLALTNGREAASRRLLHVVLSRARNHLVVTQVGPKTTLLNG